MRNGKAVRQDSFIAVTFPHLESLFQGALWLSMRGHVAEKLVLNTMARAYREWHDVIENYSAKVHLFKILALEFFVGERQEPIWHQTDQHRSGSINKTINLEEKILKRRLITIKQNQLTFLTNIPKIRVKGAIAHLKPFSRFLLILLYRERFTYAEIAYITDLPQDTLINTLNKIRRMLPKYINQNAHNLGEANECESPAEIIRNQTASENNNNSCQYSFFFPDDFRINLATDDWENEGGTIASLSKG